MLSVIVSGIVTGMLYAIAGLGLVVVYRTSRVLNFAMGGMGAVSTYAAVDLLVRGVPYGLVFLLVLVVGALTGLVVELGVARPLRRLPPLTVGVGTLGALLVLQGALGARFGYDPQPVPLFLADAGTLRIGSFAISANQLFILGVGGAATALLSLLMSRTSLGMTMRAASSGPQTCGLLGVDVSRTRLLAWMIGGAYGALAAVLVTPLTYLAPSSFTAFLLTAFAAVVLGGFTSISGVVIGAVFFGVAINLLQVYLSPSLIEVYTFVGVALVLMLRPHGLFGQREHEIPEAQLAATGSEVDLGERDRKPGAAVAAEDRRAALPQGRLRSHWSAWGLALVVLAALPFLVSSTSLFLLATALASFIGILGLNILVGYTGQVSLGHSAFLALGAVTSAVATTHGVPPLVTLPLALVVGAVAGLLIGWPAARLSGLYLVLLTLTFAFAVPPIIRELEPLTGGANGLPLALPASLATPADQYWFVLAIASVVTLVTLVVTRSRLGRGWRAVRDSEDGARALGLRPTVIKLGAFAISSARAALSGALSGMFVGFITPETYGVFLSIYALLAVVLGGTGSVFGSLLGALFITFVPQFTQGSGVPQDLVFGVAMIAVLLLAPSGVVGLLERLADRVAAVLPQVRLRRATSSAVPPASPVGMAAESEDETPRVVGDLVEPRLAVAVAAAEQSDGPVVETPRAAVAAGAADLQLHEVSAGYGMVDVLHRVSLHVDVGEVVALIGANGVGKSTLLRTVSGLLTPSAGTVLWRGAPISEHTSPHRVARLGIGHVPEGRAIFPDLTVVENLRMGAFGVGGRARPGDGIDRVFDRFPVLAERAGQRAGTLSGGQQQMLAIGRALVGRPDLLMLDEPSLGLAPVIVQQVFEILRDLADDGLAVLLVEQNAQAALALADRAYVLSRGRVVLEGTGSALADDERIRDTYLAVGAS